MALEFISPEHVPFLSTFLLVFAVVFGLLAVSKAAGMDRRVNAVIALSIAMFSSFYRPLVDGLQQYMPLLVAALIIVFFAVLLKKVFQRDDEKKHVDAFPIIIALGLLLVVLIVISDSFVALMPAGSDPSTILWIIGFVVVVLFFWAAYKIEKGVGER